MNEPARMMPQGKGARGKGARDKGQWGSRGVAEMCEATSLTLSARARAREFKK